MAWPSVIHVHHQTIGFAKRNSLIRFYQTLVQLENSTTTQQLTIQHADEVIAYCTCITNHNPRMILNNCPISQQTEQISEKWDNKFENTQGNTLPVQSGICKQNGSWQQPALTGASTSKFPALSQSLEVVPHNFTCMHHQQKETPTPNRTQRHDKWCMKMRPLTMHVGTHS